MDNYNSFSELPGAVGSNVGANNTFQTLMAGQSGVLSDMSVFDNTVPVENVLMDYSHVIPKYKNMAEKYEKS